MRFIEIPKVNRDNQRRKNKRQADPLRTRYGHKTVDGAGVVGRVYRKCKAGKK